MLYFHTLRCCYHVKMLYFVTSFLLLTSPYLLFGQGDSKSFEHVTRKDNIINNWTLFDHPDLNMKPSALIFVTHEESYLIGTWYDSRNQKWSVYREDRKPMKEGVKFSIEIHTASDQVFTHVTSEENVIHNKTILDHPSINNQPKAKINLALNWIDTYNPSPMRLRYVGGHWEIYNTDGTKIPLNVRFNIHRENL